MLNFIKKWIKKSRQVELAGLKSQLKAEEAMSKLSGGYYPIVLSMLNKRIGELEELLKDE